jgi:hypothetical protein
MPGSSTTARVIKGPREASQLLWHSIHRPSAPLVPRESRVGLTPRLGKTNRSRRRFTVHLIMASEPCERATDWVPVAQLPTYAKNWAPRHLPTHRDTKRHNNCYPAQRLTGPLARFTALEGITHPSKASGATPSGCASAHPPDSFLQNKQTTTHPNGMMRAHAAPPFCYRMQGIMIRQQRGHPASLLQRAEAQGFLPHLDPLNGQSHWLGASSHVLWSYEKLHARLKPLKGSLISPRSRGLHPPGAIACTHRIVFFKHKTNQKLPMVTRSQATKGVLHSTGLGASVGYQNTGVPNRRQNMAPCTITKAPS